MTASAYDLRQWICGYRNSDGLIKVVSKSGFAAARSRMVVHRVVAMAAVRDCDRIQFGARWVCGNGSVDAVAVADPDAYGGFCERCDEVLADRQTGLCVVYRCFDAAGQLLYVGSTSRGASTRLQFHEKNAAWWPAVADVQLESFDRIEAARAAESRAIRTEHPKHNVHGRARRGAGAA